MFINVYSQVVAMVGAVSTDNASGTLTALAVLARGRAHIAVPRLAVVLESATLAASATSAALNELA